MVFRAFSLLMCAVALMHVSTCWGADEETREVKAQELTLQIPKAWTEKPASSSLRLAQFEVAPVAGDSDPAEVVVFPPFGGSAAENIKRWVSQFENDGLKAEFTQGKSTQGSYVVADLSGTFHKPDGPPIMRKTKATPGYRVINVMLTSEKGGSYFLKITGPQKTVEAAADSFRKSFGADKSKETKYEF